MNLIHQRLTSLRSRTRDLQGSLRRWALYADVFTHESKEAFLTRWTPGERSDYTRDIEQTRPRLRPVQVHIEILGTWCNYVIEAIEEQLTQAQTLLEQGRTAAALAQLGDVETRLINPTRETLAYATRSFSQRMAPTTAHRMTALDAIIRSLYLPTIKNATQRGLLTRESLSRTPIAILAGSAAEDSQQWRRHAVGLASVGRFIPVSMVAVRQELLAEPWNIGTAAFDVGVQIYSDLDLAWELAHKLSREATLTGVSPRTATFWAAAHETLFADIFGILQLGPAYASAQIERLAQCPEGLFAPTAGTALPVYVRWHVMLQTLALLNFADEARERFTQIHALCGDPNQIAQRLGDDWRLLIAEARAIAGLVALSPMQKLGGARVIDLVTPMQTTERSAVNRVKEVIESADEGCSEDAGYEWAKSLRDVPAHLALAGLRSAFDATPQQDAATQFAIRFWCLIQFLSQENSTTREREDREYAPKQEMLKNIARRGTTIGTPAAATYGQASAAGVATGGGYGVPTGAGSGAGFGTNAVATA